MLFINKRFIAIVCIHNIQFIHMYPQCLVKLKQSCLVTMINAKASKSLGVKLVLTLPNTDSRGLRSGEYGSRNRTFVPGLVMSCTFNWTS